MINEKAFAGLYRSVGVYDFHRAFEDADRTNSFSYGGRIALFEYLEHLAEDLAQPIELDVIAICCDYSEFENLEDFKQQYSCSHDCGPIEKICPSEIGCECGDCHKFMIEIEGSKGFLVEGG